MSDFRIAVNITMDDDHEGGFQKLHNDSGNWTGGAVGVGELKGTKYGLSAAQFPNLDIENLTKDQAAAIYKEGYWKQNYSEIESQAVASKLFDMGVLFGVGAAVKTLQVTLQPAFPDVHPDGAFGQITLSAVNQSDEASLLQAYKTSLVARALKIVQLHPEKKTFVVGWGKRINS